MAANLAWLQKWSTQLGWTDAWSDGWPLQQSTDIAAVGHATLSQTGLSYKIEFQLGALTLATVGHSTLSGNVTSVVPGDHTLGNLQIALGGRMTTATGGFNTVDPLWIDPPNLLPMTGRMGFPGTITISKVLLHPLGAVTLPMVGHGTLSSPTTGLFVRKELGALTLQMIGGVDLTAALQNKDGVPFDLVPDPFAMYGRSTVAANNLTARLPPHPLGDVTLAMTGQPTVATLRIFSGGPISIGALTLAMTGRAGIHFDLSYPPFDTGSEIRAELDPSVTTMVARVDPDSLSVQ